MAASSSRPPRSRIVKTAVDDARAVTARVRHDYDPTVRRARRQSRRVRLFRRFKRFTLMSVVGLVGLVTLMLAWSFLIDPLGILGFLLFPLLGMLVLMGAGFFSRERRILPQALGQATTLPQIAARADDYLHQQRRTLPAPAQDLTDLIGQRLASIGPQLATLEHNGPQATELRRLVGDELPDLIDRYKRVPPQMRSADRNGRVPERDLIDGLQLLDAQIDDVVHGIAAADMDRLASHRRYLELRYSDGGEAS